VQLQFDAHGLVQSIAAMTGPTKARTVPPTGPDSAYAGRICTTVIAQVSPPVPFGCALLA
jgi:hypothetical protein